jgi:amino acid transporter
MSSQSGNTGELAKETNWWGAFVIGLSGTILVVGLVGYATVAMGGFSIPMFLVLTGIGVFLCYCLAELAAAMPDRAGGLPSYAFETFKPLGDNVAKHLGGLSSWGYWLGWFTVAPINAIIAGNYIASLLDLPAGKTFDPFGTSFGLPITSTGFILAGIILVVMFIPCYLGIRLGAKFATVLGVASIIPLILLVLLPFIKPSKLDFGRLDGFGMNPAEAYAGVGLSFPFIMGWAFIFTWSVLAMEAAACYIGECKEPARDAKIAMTAEGLFGFFVYLAVPIMIISVLGVEGLGGFESEGFLGDAQVLFTRYTTALFGTSTFWEWFVGLMLVIALLLSVLNAVMGCARGLYQNSHDGILPRAFGHTNKHGVPDYAMFFNLACSFVLLLVGSPLEIYIFSNMGYLFAAAISLIGFAVYKIKRPDAHRPVNMPAWMTPVALVLGIFLLFTWVYGGYFAADYAVGANKRWLFWLGLGLLALYFPLYAWRKAEDRKAGTAAYSRGTVRA